MNNRTPRVGPRCVQNARVRESALDRSVRHRLLPKEEKHQTQKNFAMRGNRMYKSPTGIHDGSKVPQEEVVELLLLLLLRATLLEPKPELHGRERSHCTMAT